MKSNDEDLGPNSVRDLLNEYAVKHIQLTKEFARVCFQLRKNPPDVETELFFEKHCPSQLLVMPTATALEFTFQEAIQQNYLNSQELESGGRLVICYLHGPIKPEGDA